MTTPTDPPPLHPELAPVASLLGTWSGAGHGEYPTIDPFDYVESITFGHVGKPFLSYLQRTRGAETGLPMHAEAGYWRFPAPGRVEIVLSHPSGIVEVEEGTIDIDEHGAITIDVATTSVSTTSSAKQVDALTRWFRVDGDRLDYRVGMAAVGQSLRHHLAATLHRERAS